MIALYWPNIVGYARLTLLLFGLFIVWSHPILGCICFIVNLVLDAVDGFLARLLNQVSAFGAILDYTTDRISFASYAFLLGSIYPQYTLVFCLFLNLDLASHFFHLQASHVQNRVTHKAVSKNDPWILQFYYKKVVLGAACFTHDLFFIFLYLHFFFPSFWLELFLGITFVGVVFKTLVHLIQIVRASIDLLTVKKNTLNVKAAEDIPEI